MLVNICEQLLEVITTLFCMYMLHDKKFVLNFSVFVLSGIDLIGYEIIRSKGIPVSPNIIIYISLIIYTVCLFEDSLKELIVNIVLVSLNIGLLHLFTTILVVNIWVLAGIRFSESLACSLVVFLLTIVINKTIGYMHIKRWVLSQKGISAFIASICTVSIVYGFFSVRITSTPSAIFYMCVVFFCSITCIVCFQWLRQRELTREKAIDLQIYELYYDSFQALLKELRAKQHDFKNHIQTIQNQHYVCSDYESLVQAQRTYCEEIVKDDKYAGLLGCTNSIIAGFLYGKFIEIEKRGISVEYEVHISRQQYSVPLYVIVETLGILLDNAAEYVQEKNNPEIKMKIWESTSRLRIKVVNSIEKMTVIEFMNYFEIENSTKGYGRGIGLTKISQYGEKYGWETLVKIEEENDNRDLVIEVVIPLG